MSEESGRAMKGERTMSLDIPEYGAAYVTADG